MIAETEKRLMSGLRKRLILWVLLYGSVLALGLRFCLLPYQSSDYVYFLQDWYGQLAANGGLNALH